MSQQITLIGERVFLMYTKSIIDRGNHFPLPPTSFPKVSTSFFLAPDKTCYLFTSKEKRRNFFTSFFICFDNVFIANISFITTSMCVHCCLYYVVNLFLCLTICQLFTELIYFLFAHVTMISRPIEFSFLVVYSCNNAAT